MPNTTTVYNKLVTKVILLILVHLLQKQQINEKISMKKNIDDKVKKIPDTSGFTKNKL